MNLLAVPWFSTVVVIVFAILALWVFFADSSPRPLGLMGFVLSGITAINWFTTLPIWVDVVIIVLAFILFLIGMLIGRRSPDKDDKWHYGAFAVGLFGKLLCALIPAIIGIGSGSSQIPNWVIAVAVVAAVLLAVPRTRRLIARPFRQRPKKTAAPAGH